ncbi:hypothetical protein BXA16_10655 [Salmonella enterica subsp. enterica serovar Typhimurium]|nr:hypothetical protein BXA16_10655 [Salmonella enterica subsp. enterica serovar Typhimurium]
MRVLIPFTVLFLSGCSHLANDHWSGQDKAQHFMASAMLSAAGNEYARHGASKELWDSRPEGSGWSWKDFVWDVAGATTGYAIWQMARY